MKFGLKINTEFPIKKQKTPFMTTLGLMFFRGFVIKKKQIIQFLLREHIPMNITTKFGSNWPSGFGED
jgi:hypothetical protein